MCFFSASIDPSSGNKTLGSLDVQCAGDGPVEPTGSKAEEPGTRPAETMNLLSLTGRTR
jgi:hypothetical protein